MTEFKCIHCGEIKESDQQCSCPVCGYRMFEAPFDRRAVLCTEIEGFISRLEVKTLIREDLIVEGKDQDDHRFPSFDQILKYVSGRDKTEDFIRNLKETADQLKTHFASEFSKTYSISNVFLL